MNGLIHSELVFPFMNASLTVSAIPNAPAIPNRKIYSECKNPLGMAESRPLGFDVGQQCGRNSMQIRAPEPIGTALFRFGTRAVVVRWFEMMREVFSWVHPALVWNIDENRVLQVGVGVGVGVRGSCV
jgi:hypothetical protein